MEPFEINTNPTEEEMKLINSQDSHDPEDVAPIVEVTDNGDSE